MNTSDYESMFSSLESLDSNEQKSDFIQNKISELKSLEKAMFRNSKKLSRMEVLNEKLKFHENLQVEKALLLKLHGLKENN